MPIMFSSDGTSIAYDVTGAGPTLVLVCGAIQHRAIDPSVAELAGLLSTRFTVISYDRRGRGESGDTTPYAVEREIEDIAGLIAAHGGRAHLFGLSSGAILALEAVAAGLPIDRLALYEPPFAIAGARPDLPPDYVEQLDRHLRAGDRDSAAEVFFAEGVALPREMIEGMKQSPFWPVVVGVAPTLAYDARITTGAHGATGFTPRFASIAIPVLVIDGDASMPYMRPAADAIAAHLGAERQTLSGQDHGPRPQAIAPGLIDFFGR